MDAPKDMQVDHIKHNRLDNRKNKLRLCTNAQNAYNSRKKQRKASSQYKGVSWCSHTKKWKSQLCYEGFNMYLGYFDSELAAARVYDNTAEELFGEFACLNFPRKEESNVATSCK